MIDVSAVGTILTFTGGLNEVTFDDVSDFETPIDFGTIEPFGTEFDLNHELVVRHRQVTPEMSVAFIPGSKSDRKLRAFLLSSLIDDTSANISSPSNVMIPYASLKIAEGDDVRTFSFHEGYLVGGSVALGANSDGRLVTKPYRFVFKYVTSWTKADLVNGIEKTKGDAPFYATAIIIDDEQVENLYFARVSASAPAQMISHPIESGAVVFDHKFRNPQKVEVKVKVPLAVSDKMVAEFYKWLNDRTLKSSGSEKTAYKVETKTEIYKNLSLIDISHAEDPDAFDLIEYTLSFQELMFSSAKGETRTADASNADTQPTTAKGVQSSRPTA